MPMFNFRILSLISNIKLKPLKDINDMLNVHNEKTGRSS